MRLDKADLDELRYIAAARDLHQGTQPPHSGFTRDLRRARMLVAKGFLNVETFSEPVQDGATGSNRQRFKWPVFYLTNEGRRAIQP